MGEMNEASLEVMKNVKRAAKLCPNTPASSLSLPSFAASPPEIEEMLEQFDMSRHLVVQSLTYLGNYLRTNREVLKQSRQVIPVSRSDVSDQETVNSSGKSSSSPCSISSSPSKEKKTAEIGL